MGAGFLVASAFRLDADAVALRRQISTAAGDHWHTRVQFSVPAAGVSLARAVTWFIHDLPPQARDALQAVRSASVGVYGRSGADDARTGGALIADTDRAMARRGWTRIVGVVDDENTVLIYLPSRDEAGPPDQVCLAVCSGSELVVVAARFNARPLLRLVSREVEAGRFTRL